MRKNSWKKKECAGLALTIALLSVILPVGILYLGIKIDFYDVFWYLSPSVELMCVAWFVAFQRCEEKVTDDESESEESINVDV